MLTDHDVSSTDKLQSGLEDEDVGDVDEVAGVVDQQPHMDVFGGLVRKRPADGNQPHVPVPRRHNNEEPDDVDQVCGGQIRSTNTDGNFYSAHVKRSVLTGERVDAGGEAVLHDGSEPVRNFGEFGKFEIFGQSGNLYRPPQNFKGELQVFLFFLFFFGCRSFVLLLISWWRWRRRRRCRWSFAWGCKDQTEST